MKIETKTAPSHTQKFCPIRPISPEGWASYCAELEADGCQINGDQFGYTVTFPEKEYICAPTLGIVHKWLWDDWGLFHLSWQDGLLCPFDECVGTKNITCSNGRRKRCVGLAIHQRLVAHLPEGKQQRLIGRVVCYEWAHILSNAYWDIPNEELLELPDNPSLVAFHILRRVIRATGWLDWKRELNRRQNRKRRRDWLTSLPPRKRQEFV